MFSFAPFNVYRFAVDFVIQRCVMFSLSLFIKWKSVKNACSSWNKARRDRCFTNYNRLRLFNKTSLLMPNEVNGMQIHSHNYVIFVIDNNI